MGLVDYMHEHHYQRVDTTPEAEQAWNEHVKDMYNMLLLRKAKSWFTGYNENIDGREGSTRYLIYNGGAPRYRKRLAEVAANDYEGFVFD